jgi:5-oxoprolinase (ATP-hydrolysing)
VRIRAPMMLIHTVAAGGGSILHFGCRPLSVSVRIPPAPIPDPAAIVNGGPLAVTDANVMTLASSILNSFRRSSGQVSDERLDVEAVRRHFAAAGQTVGLDSRPQPGRRG